MNINTNDILNVIRSFNESRSLLTDIFIVRGCTHVTLTSMDNGPTISDLNTVHKSLIDELLKNDCIVRLEKCTPTHFQSMLVRGVC